MGDRVPAWIRRTELFAQIQVHATLQFVRGYTGAQSLGVFEDPFSHEVLHPGRYLVGVGVEDMAGFDGAVVVLSARRAHGPTIHCSRPLHVGAFSVCAARSIDAVKSII